VNVLIVAAHPDDEALGCGGTIARHSAEGDRVEVAFLADGVTSRDSGADHTDEISRRRQAALAAAEILGVSEVHFGDLPDNRLDSVGILSLAQVVESLMRDAEPDVIYTHHAHDLNVDHRLVHEAVMTASRPLPGSRVSLILAFETASSTEWRSPQAAHPFAANWYVDITDTLAVKMLALKAYGEEMRLWPHPRSPEAVGHLAHWRGATVGRGAAEAFVLARHIS